MERTDLVERSIEDVAKRISAEKNKVCRQDWFIVDRKKISVRYMLQQWSIQTIYQCK